MRTPYKIILIVSAILTALLFWHDAIYDGPEIPYTFKQALFEIVIVGSLYTGLFFLVLSGFYMLAEEVVVSIVRRKKKDNDF